MKNLVLSIIFAILLLACVSKSSKTTESQDCCAEAKQTSTCCSEKTADVNLTATDSLVVTVDQLLANPENYIDKKIELQGLVMHTCKKTGKKMFLKGTNDSIFVRIEAGESISKFEPALEGETVVASGVINISTTNDTHENGESCTSEEKARDYVMTCENFKQI